MVATSLPTRLLFLLFFTSLSRLQAIDWRPPTPGELALKAGLVDKDAHAEALIWEVWVSDELSVNYPQNVLTQYVKVKVFDERGAEMLSKIDITYLGKTNISAVAARTTKPDGSVVELKKDAIFDRTVVKASGFKVKAKSFAIPGVEPGAIIEYRWTEHHDDQLANYLELQLQREYPVQSIRYHLKPLSSPYFPFGMRTMTFNPPKQEGGFVREQNGYYGVAFSNAPAYHEEPRMPPEHEVRGWMLVYYSPDEKIAPDKYWKQHGRKLYDQMKQHLKVDKDVKRTADSVLEGATDPEEKLRRLYKYCRNSIKNTEGGGHIDKKDKENATPSDTLRKGRGSSFDIDLLFAALAEAAGFDARFARVSDRSRFFFKPNMLDTYFMSSYDVAVNVNGKWRFFDPASKFLPFGMLQWQEEYSAALIADPKDPEVTITPHSTPEKTLKRHRGTFRLGANGSLEGDVRIEYTGHEGIVVRHEYDGKSDDTRENAMKENLEGRYRGEISDLKIENLADVDQPVVITFHIKTDNYAQRTGKRLFFQPAFFSRGVQAMFTASARQYPVYFNYPWTETEENTFELPAGYELENPEIPPEMTLGPAGTYSMHARYNPQKGLLTCTRDLVFGKGGIILFPADSYPALKNIFEKVQKSDDWALTIKQGK